MSSDNYCVVVKNPDNTYDVLHGFASDEEGWAEVVGSFDNLEDAFVYADAMATEYGVSFVDRTKR